MNRIDQFLRRSSCYGSIMIFLICGRYDTMMCWKKCQSDEDVFYLMIDPFVVICSLL